MEMVAEYLTDLAIADCLATMRARMCVKRHGDVALDRYFKGVGRRSEGNVVVGARSDDPAAYMPPRRLWSRIGLKARKKTDRAVYNKLAIMRHVRWVIENGKLDESEWGRRFSEFATRIRARVKRGDFNFEMPVSFAVEKPGKGDTIRDILSQSGGQGDSNGGDKALSRSSRKLLRVPQAGRASCGWRGAASASCAARL